jgi:hypothetical protein
MKSENQHKSEKKKVTRERAEIIEKDLLQLPQIVKM